MLQEESMDDINLFSLITVLSFLLSCPLMLLAEGVKFSPAYLQSTVSHCQQNSDKHITRLLRHNFCSK
jgi:solute carrier family 35 protein E1